MTQQAVVVTTAHRGVFFGYEISRDGSTIKLRDARNCLYWSVALRGFLGLARYGPDEDCRVGPEVDELELLDVTSVSRCADDAVKKWEAAPWKS